MAKRRCDGPRFAATRPEKPPSNEERYLTPRIPLSKRRPAILCMGLELFLATGAKMMKLSAKSLSSELLSNRRKSGQRSASARRGLDATEPERVFNVSKSEAEGAIPEHHPAKS